MRLAGAGIASREACCEARRHAAVDARFSEFDLLDLLKADVEGLSAN